MNEKPPLSVLTENIPQFPKNVLLWCVWAAEIIDREGQSKPGKFPISPVTGKMIGVDRPKEWSAYEEVDRALREGHYAGIGVLLRREDQVVGIDLDHAIDDKNVFTPWAYEIVTQIKCYWELSPSGRGLRGLVRGTIPGDLPKKLRVDGGLIEVYTAGRFLTITGQRLPNSTIDVEECVDGLNWLAERLRPKHPQPTHSATEPEVQAEIAGILDGCAWIRYCRDNSEKLPEPDWYYSLTVLAHCQNGAAVAHEWSRPYARYSREETDAKLRQALARSGPVTCEYVRTGLGHANLCQACPSFGQITSPISLGGSPRIVAEENWPEPQPLSRELIPVEPFDVDLLPNNYRPYAQDVRERMQVPLDFVGAPLMVAQAAVAGRRARIRPKQHDDWEEAANLWGGLVSDPGSMKTPSINEVLRFLHEIEGDLARQFETTRTQYERAFEIFEARQKAWKQEASKLASRGGPVPAFDEIEPTEPTCGRVLVNDATPQKMQEVLAANPAGIMLYRDEIAGWFASMDAEGRETDRPFYLETWSGNQSYTVDRVGRGTVRAAKLCLGVFGGVQPNVLRRYLLSAILGGKGDDGFAQRLQVVVYPDLPDRWTYVDRPPDFHAREIVADVFRTVAARPPEEFVAQFDPAAQAFHTDWRTQLEMRLRTEPMPTYLKSHLAKYRGLMPRMALNCHLADSGFQRFIPFSQAKRAAAWCTYLESHARRIYSDASPKSMASVLGDKIQGGALGARFTVRELLKKGWASLDNHTVVLAILQELVEAGWLRKEQVQRSERGGRPADAYLVNPKVLSKSRGPTAP